MNVGIVGAGVAGLAAAKKLQALGHTVTLFENRHEVGGQVVTFDVGGEPLECFYHHIFNNDTTVIRYFDELGLGDRLEWIEPNNAHFVKGRSYRFVTPLDLLKFTAIPFVSRVRLGLATLWLQRQKDWRKYETTSARKYLERAIGKRAFQAFWGPLLRGKFGMYADEVSMAWLHWKIRLRFGSRTKGGLKEELGYPRGSFRIYYDALAKDIEASGGTIHLNTRVEDIEVSSGAAIGITVGGEMHEFDAVLMTTPNIITRKLVPELPPDYAAILDSVRYQWATCLVLELDRPLSDVYWLSIADDLPFVACVEHTNLIDPRRYGGVHVVYLSNYVSTGDPVLDMDAEEVVDRYADGLRAINPAFENSWVQKMHFFTDPGGQPVIGVNYSKSVPDTRTGIGGLYLANTTQIYPEDRGQNYSLELGEQVAELIDQDARSIAGAKGARI